MTEAAIEQLEPLIGEWRADALGGVGRAVFEWTLDGAFLTQRTELDHPEAPSSLSIYAVNLRGDGFTNHYFDSRGIVRVLSMTFSDGVWTMLRESEDFSALNFQQRWTGRFSDDGRRIDGTWEINHGDKWEKDFDMVYVKTG